VDEAGGFEADGADLADEAEDALWVRRDGCSTRVPRRSGGEEFDQLTF
jgi:hypothetical protein